MSKCGCARAAVGPLALGSGAALLAGCQFGGLNSLDMPGTAGHGSGSYTITVELPDVATLPQNSPVMVDDVTVGSVSGIEAVQRADGTLLRGGEAVAGREREPAGELDGHGRADVAARLPAHRAGAAGGRRVAAGKLRDGSNIPIGSIGRYPTTEEVLSSLGVVVNKGNLGALQDITDEVYAAVAGRTGSFAGLIPRLAELARLAGQPDQRHHRRGRGPEPLRRASSPRARTAWAARSTRCPPR